MRVRVLNSAILLAIASSFITNISSAATITDVWNLQSDIPSINHWYVDNARLTQPESALHSLNVNSSNPYKLFALQQLSVQGVSHTRYAEYWHNMMIWGNQIIAHHHTQTKITGSLVSQIEKDIPNVKPTFSSQRALQKAQQLANKMYGTGDNLQDKKTKLIIYINDKSFAKLAYYITFYTKEKISQKLHHPVFILDANTLTVLTSYDNLQTIDAGTGPGGNDITGLGFRSTNHYQFGNALVGLPALGFIPITINGGTCSMLTPALRLSSYGNQTLPNDDVFPIHYVDEGSFPIFSYACGVNNQNANDNGESPIINNGFSAYSPNNDTFYFGNLTYRMMQIYIPEITNPWGPSLPIRAYTHIANLDNAFAITPINDVPEPSSALKLDTTFNAQFIIGNGQTDFYPLSDSGTIGHELSHIFTGFHSNLTYAQQSGGINEAYSDIVGATLDFYISQLYPWYGFSWEVGPSVSLPSGPYAGKATRYMNNPPLDGHSIANANGFIPGMDVHYSSGVYNYAFYLMVTQYHMNMFNAYRYFSFANAMYWQPSSDYDHASCGVMQAAIDLHNKTDFQNIMSAFKEVGVHCKVGMQQLQQTI